MTSATPARTAVPPLRLDDVPRPPHAAVRVLAACADPSAELPHIAAIIATDPVLAADLLRVVNSAYFGLGRDIATIGQAVSLLGLRAVRNRVVCLIVRNAASSIALPGVDTAAFVEDSLRRAVTARALAAVAGADAEDAFAGGLLQDLGLLLLLAAHPSITPRQWAALRGAEPEARLVLERSLFGTTHDVVLGDLARGWHLPPVLVNAIAQHHRDAPGEALAKVLAAADRVTAVFASGAGPAAVQAAVTMLETDYGMDAERAREWLAAIPASVQQAAVSLGMTIPAQHDLDQLAARINTRLAADNLDFQEMNWRLQQALRERDELAATLAAELEIAREIQCSLLPAATPVTHPIWARNVAARELSGDFYDYFTTARGRLLFNLGDVSGKGLTAALLMAKTCGLFRCLGRRLDRLEEIIGIINDEICETTVRGMFVTMIAGAYDAASQSVEIVSAGHPPPLLLRHGRSVALAPGGDLPPLGIVPGLEFQTRRLSLADASLYLYSDGMSEAVDANGDEIGSRGLARLIAASGALPPARRIDSILAAIATNDHARRDDITLAILDPAGLH